LIPSPRFLGGISVKTVRRVLAYFRTHGHVEKIPRSLVPNISDEHAALLIEIICDNPWLYLDEMSAELHLRSGAAYTPISCYKELIRRGYTLKTMQYAAVQRDEEQRQLYWNSLNELHVRPEYLLFCDETSKKNSDLRRKRGWGGRGVRVTRRSILHHQKNLSILALYGISGFVDFDCKEGGYSADSFMEAFEFMILPHLRRFPGPCSVLVMDNCQIHHTYEAEILALAASVGARVIFLAPYSPIDSPIEPAFNVFKMHWTRHLDYFETLPVVEAVRECLFHCYENPAESAVEAYRHCGYS